MKRIVLTGGGTAGHVIPHVALIPLLKGAGYSIDYIGSIDGIEKELIEDKTDITYHGIQSGKLRRYLTFNSIKENIKDQFKIMKGFSQAKKY